MRKGIEKNRIDTLALLNLCKKMYIIVNNEGIWGDIYLQNFSNIEIIDFINKSAKYMCEETDANKLFGDFLDMSVQIAGADKGYLILEDKGDLYVAAAREACMDNAVVKNLPLKECDMLSREAVWFVKETLDTLYLDCRENTEIFKSDPYIAEYRPQFIAALPLVLQGTPFGVLYLENSLTSNAFTSESLEILKILSVQIASARVLQMYLDGTKASDDDKAYPNLVDPLTKKETEVLMHLAEGMSNREIADKLGITINTVKGYIKNIYGKLGVNRRVQAIDKAKKS